MARKSRYAQKDKVAVQAQRIYKTALYGRLSVQDGGVKESDTAATQEAVLRNFIEDKAEFILADVYMDNGETGTDFQRSEFEHLIEDVRNGKVDCIIVKDLSRFGRNYIETGEYLEKIFPFLGVRFIAINDNYDSLNPATSDILTMHLKNLVNDIYARDISQKICSALSAKQEQGEFIGDYAPYGYLKSPENKNKLVVNPDTAPVVRDIFEWRKQGATYGGIAKKLWELKILSPNSYLQEAGIIKRERIKDCLWNDTEVKKILSSEVYLGHLIQRKTQAALWKGQERTFVPETQQVIVRNTHEPIVDEQTFAEVQAINQEVSEKHNNMESIGESCESKENLFNGAVFCGLCGARLKRSRQVDKNSKNEYRVRYWLRCRTHLKIKELCPFISISEESLIDTVYQTIKTQIVTVADMKKLMEQDHYQNLLTSQITSNKAQIHAVTAELKRIAQHQAALYDHYAEQLMNERDYLYAQHHYKKKEESLYEELAALEEQKLKIVAKSPQENSYLKTVLAFKDSNVLTRNMVEALIEKVVVYSTTRVEIQFRFEDEYQKLKEMLVSMMEVEQSA